jgi:hypothetical protein
MTLAQLGIPFLYGIPDPEGYFMPALPVVALALASGLSALWESDLRAWLWGAAAAAFVALGAMRMQWFFLTEFSPDITLGAREGAVDFVFPTLFETIPEGSNFVVPCGHYGGVEVAIYYMLADETVRRKHIKFVRFSWSEWNDGLMPVTVVDETWAKTHVVCTVLKEDVQKLKDKGVPLQRLERTPYVRDWKEHRGAPLYCSAMSAAEAPR